MKTQSTPDTDIYTNTVRISFTDPNTQTAEIITELTELLHKHNLKLSVKGNSKLGAPKQNPEGEIICIFSDINKQITLPSARQARKWLRKHSETVTLCRKEDNKWIFTKSSPSTKIYFKSVK